MDTNQYTFITDRERSGRAHPFLMCERCDSVVDQVADLFEAMNKATVHEARKHAPNWASLPGARTSQRA